MKYSQGRFSFVTSESPTSGSWSCFLANSKNDVLRVHHSDRATEIVICFELIDQKVCQICACYRMAGYVGSDHGRAARWRIVLEDGRTRNDVVQPALDDLFSIMILSLVDPRRNVGISRCLYQKGA